MNGHLDIKTEALKNGLIWGIINIVLFTAVWYISPNLMGSFIYGSFTFVLGLGLAIFFCLDMRKKVGGYWTFQEALWPIFVVFLSSMALVFVYTQFFSSVIDPSYPEKMKEIVLKQTEETFNTLGIDNAAKEEAMNATLKSLDEQFSPTISQLVRAFGIAAILYFIGAVIFALIFKKSNPNPFADINSESEESESNFPEN
jgi:hypothetical protein